MLLSEFSNGLGESMRPLFVTGDHWLLILCTSIIVILIFS